MHLNKKIGKLGEILACRYLEKNKYNILNRNFNCRQGEIDIIACDNNSEELVFFEVKTRTNLKYGMPRDAINDKKKKHIINSAKYYNYKNKIGNISIRFDIIEVLLINDKYIINHIKGAF